MVSDSVWVRVTFLELYTVETTLEEKPATVDSTVTKVAGLSSFSGFS